MSRAHRLSLSPSDLLAWAALEETVEEVETRLLTAGLTLGPAAVWGGTLLVREWLKTRSALRYNPLLGRLEELVSAFAYQRHGRSARTVSAPREACGPELRSLLFDDLEQVSAVELRLLPAQPLRWFQFVFKEQRNAHDWLRIGLGQGLGYRALWSQKGLLWLSLGGAMADAHGEAWSELSMLKGGECRATSEPVMGSAYRSYGPAKRRWAEVDGLDNLLLADPWRLLVRHG